MTSYVYAGGLGGPSSSEYTGTKFYQGTAPVLYVNSNTGTDGTDRGRSRHNPLATLAYAIGTIATGSGYVIVVEAGHEERLTDEIALNQPITICGEGTGDSRPSIRQSDPGVYVFSVASGGVTISGLRFVEATDYGDFTRIAVNSSSALDLRVSNCDFAFGDKDVEYGQSYGILIAVGTGFNGFFDVSDCSFSVSYTAGAATFYNPCGIYITGGTGMTLRVKDCTFSGGSVGWCSMVGSNDGPFYIDDVCVGMTGAAMLSGASGYISPGTIGIATAVYDGIGDILW
jgi:hypothetical protein